MEHVREICQTVDQFIAPSRHLRSRFVSEFGIPSERVTLLDYGFDLARLRGRTRLRRDREEFVFGYIGTHIPAKGVHHLLEAFASLKQPARLRLWGRPNSETTPALKSICASLPIEVQQRITWEGEYKNERIVPEVFDHVDAIVVPSIWLENSPLVIHEAQQARVPVITADVGGMAEFVQHEVNGLLFRHRDSTALAEQMARFVGYPEWAAQLGARGYLYSTSGDVPSIQDHLAVIEQTYGRCLKGSSSPAMEVGV
jgi:glycosyltransferase involved in cell wall biosynthesis